MLWLTKRMGPPFSGAAFRLAVGANMRAGSSSTWTFTVRFACTIDTAGQDVYRVMGRHALHALTLAVLPFFFPPLSEPPLFEAPILEPPLLESFCAMSRAREGRQPINSTSTGPCRMFHIAWCQMGGLK